MMLNMLATQVGACHCYMMAFSPYRTIAQMLIQTAYFSNPPTSCAIVSTMNFVLHHFAFKELTRNCLKLLLAKGMWFLFSL